MQEILSVSVLMTISAEVREGSNSNMNAGFMTISS